MPHIIIECSESIAKVLPFEQLAPKIHETLVLMLPTELSNCKSRLLSSSQYLIGNDPQRHFLNMTLKILPGRPPETKKIIAQKILALLEQHTPTSNVSISLEIIEIDALNYYKINK